MMPALQILKEAILSEEVTRAELFEFEKACKAMMKPYGLDIHLSQHFEDRANDSRNIAPITLGQLIAFMNQELRKYGKVFAKPIPTPSGKRMPEAVLKDINTHLNLAVGFDWNARDQIMTLRLITAMRKRNFVPNDRRDRIFAI